MGTLLHFKNLYLQAFANCKPPILVTILKIYTIFCLLMIGIAMYAFMYRAFTGFEF